MRYQKNSDERLITASSGGNTEAFGILVKKYQSFICAITYSATGNVDRSEEIAQEVFFLAWQHISQLKNYAKFKSWIYTIAKNQIKKYYRSQQQDPIARAAALQNTGPVKDPTSRPLEEAISKEQQAFVRNALNRIPADYRESLVLFYREGKSVRQVADFFELSEDAAKKRLSRARQMMKSQLTDTLEHTLTSSGPRENFSVGVIGLIAVGGSVTQTASAATPVATAQTGGNFITAILQSTTAKICTVATVAVVGTGAALFIASDRENQTPPRPIVTTLPEDFDRGLVLYLSFDNIMEESSRTVLVDESPFGNDGLLTGGKIVKGRILNGLQCKAENKSDGAIIKDHASLDLDTVTIAAWIKTKRSDPRWGRILDKGWQDAYNLCIGGDYNNRQTQRDLVAFEIAQYCIYSENRIIDNKWHFITATYDGKTSSLYIDGELHSQGSPEKPMPMKHTDTDIHIGNLATPVPPPDDTAFYDGLIDEVRLYNRVLSEQQVQTLYRYQPY